MEVSQVATESVESVRFEFLSTEEVKKHSCLKVTNPNLTDLMDKPVPGGLYDPALGPLNDGDLCASCGQRYYQCSGHCGHIDLTLPVYNPLLFNTLFNILRKTCFFCHHFTSHRKLVETCVAQLELIAEGDIAGAKKLALDEPSKQEDSERSHTSHSTVHSGSGCNRFELSHREQWTSLQLSEAMSVLNNFWNNKPNQCKDQLCKAKQPKITKPTFGWFHMAFKSSDIKQNVIGGSKFSVPPSIGVEGATSSEVDSSMSGYDVDTADTHSASTVKVPLEFLKQKNFFSGHLLPSDAKHILKLLWENEESMCSFFSNIRKDRSSGGRKEGYSIFFLESILVPPIKFRPPSKGGDSVMEHPQTVLLNKVLEANIALGNAYLNNLEHSKIINRWMDLQQSVNVLFDSKATMGRNQREDLSGICQLLEKKEGLFRQKMMGKRVNFACRSVISPDPYLAVNEIGIPPYFALRLTYPERVTPWNVGKLRNAIINGPEVHPGATHYVDKSSKRILSSLNKKQRISLSRKLPSSRGVVAQPGRNYDHDFEGKTVLRHLQDGDIVLVNRQPTLHKPSIMAHVVRVLKGEKTLRMHYANCSTYNADFDGDEMNVHFPQDEISRSEAYNIVNANNQYVKPTMGEPIRGLIQDHLISAALLTKKDTFLCRDEFNQLLCSSGIFTYKPGSLSSKPGQKVVILNDEDEILFLHPAILKPEPLWTGKQIITALLNHITRGRPPFTAEKEGKLPHDFFRSTVKNGKSSSCLEKKSHEGDLKEKKAPGNEGKKKKKSCKHGEEQKSSRLYDDEKKNKLFIFKNELVSGVIDKAQFGEYGLIHTVHELYGSNAAGILLSVMSRLFTAYLQKHGFTCGVDDLLIRRDVDDERKKQLEESEQIGEKIHCEFAGIHKDDDKIIDPVELQMKIEKIVRGNGELALTNLDHRMFSALNKLTSKDNGVVKHLLSEGLFKSSGRNCISLMTTSGAKGSLVNFQQISNFLGNQELEGKRVPRMASGKTLPCFPPWDFASRAGGFIIDRFLTGLRPQEYYFHCMAGREGLVDTAVKTSRSGYLQRCLLKNLECLKICYDHTVRDGDGSIVQFSYGEDGIDVHQSSFIGEFKTLAENHEMIYAQCCGQLDRSNNYIEKLPQALEEKAKEFIDTLSLKDRVFSNLIRKDEFMKLMTQKYLLNLAQPGEPVGVLAAQSVGEPSTQMTLNTFHLAGRGEANVTLGIPRLQEILMTASKDIKTPIMTCPLQEGKSKEDAERLASKLKKVTVADIIETMRVSVLPFSVYDKEICRVYKLELNLKVPDKRFSLEDYHDTLEVAFLRGLEDAIENHVKLLLQIRGIKTGKEDVEASEKKSQVVKEGDEDDDDDGEEAEDIGLDAEKQRGQVIDEVDYDEGSEEESNQSEPSGKHENEDPVEDEDPVENEGEISKDDEENETSKLSGLQKSSKAVSSDKKTKSEVKRKKKSRAEVLRKDNDRSIFEEAKGLHFEIRFKFTDADPHILLAQIAQRTAKKIYIQSSGMVDNCRVTNCKEEQVIYYGRDPKSRKSIEPNDKEKIQALQTDGVNFEAFSKMQDDLDVRYVYSNDINAILEMYGVEAARETIIREVKHVFGSYGISINIRHLTLIADFMTHSGGYRPMNRLGGIADSVSPFSKMTFETASKFIVGAALHGEIDNLETPSARICVGLPVKMGTGSFDLMQKVLV